MAKPDFRPMPVHKVIYHPAMMTAIGPVYRAVTLIAITYWLAGCRELPNDATAFSAIVRTPNAHLTPIKSAILSVWSEIAPILKADWEAGNQRAENIRQRSSLGGKATAAKANGGRKKRSATIAPPPQPALATPFSQEARRQIERIAKDQRTHPKARLSDGSTVSAPSETSQAA